VNAGKLHTACLDPLGGVVSHGLILIRMRLHLWP
jgi:hypothetical protein